MSEVKSRILAELVIILTPLLKVSEKMIVPEANFFDDLGFDSLDMVEMIMDAEEAFGIDELPNEALAKINTIGDLVEVIMATTGHKTAATTKSPGQPPNALEAMVRQFISAPG